MTSLLFSRSVVSNSSPPHGLQHGRLPCPSPTSRVYSNSCPSSWWCHPTILFSVVTFSSCLQSFPSSESFPVRQFSTSGGQSIGALASAPVLPMNIHDWLPLWLTSLISLQSKGPSRVFSDTTVQKHQFLDLGDYFLPHFKEVFNYYLLKYFLMVFLFVFFYDSNVGVFNILL